MRLDGVHRSLPADILRVLYYAVQCSVCASLRRSTLAALAAIIKYSWCLWLYNASNYAYFISFTRSICLRYYTCIIHERTSVRFILHFKITCNFKWLWRHFVLKLKLRTLRCEAPIDYMYMYCPGPQTRPTATKPLNERQVPGFTGKQ